MTFLDNLRLGVKLPLMLVSVSVLALGISGGLSYELASTSLKKAADAQMKQGLAERGRAVEEWAADAVSGIQMTSMDPGVQMLLMPTSSGLGAMGRGDNLDGVDLGAIAQRLNFSDIFLTDNRGTVIATAGNSFAKNVNLLNGSNGTELGQTIRGALMATQKGPTISSFVLNSKGVKVVYLAKPIITSGRIEGVIVGELPVSEISSALLASAPMTDAEQAYVFTPDMSVQAVARPSGQQRDVPNDIVQRAIDGEMGVDDVFGNGLEPVFMAYEPINLFGKRYALVTEHPQYVMNAPVSALARNMILTNGILLLLIGGLSWVLARSVARPLEKLTKSIAKVSNRELDNEDVGCEKRADEIGDIMRALQSLRAELITAAIAQRKASIQGTAFRTSSAPMMTVGADFIITYVNDAMVNLFKKHMDDFRQIPGMVAVEDMVGTSMDAFHPIPERARATLRDPKNLPFHTETAIGTGRFGLDVGAIQGENGESLGFVVEWRDVTELRLNRALLTAIGNTQLLFEAGPSGALLKVNQNLVDSIGLPEERLLSMNLRDVVSEVDGDKNFWERLQKFELIVGNIHLNGPSGTIIADGTITAVPDQSKRMLRIVMIANDITVAQAALNKERDHSTRITAEQKAMVEELRVGLNALSTGDLTASIQNRFPAEYEQLREDFNAAVHNLEAAMQVVIDNAAGIDREAREINTAAEDLSMRTEKQAATLEETAAALDELTVSVSSASAVVMDANHVVIHARESAKSSGLIVEQAVSAMSEIEESSRKISRIISVIDDIAFQTNLLALNAGVEAARAGEAGRGFAVVASEVRALAQRSSEAAREIDRLITTSSDHVRRGVDLVGETGTALEKILTSVNDIASRVSEIAASSHEQASGLSEINIAVNQLDQVTQHNAAMFEQTTAASQALSRGAKELSSAATKFKTGGVVAVVVAASSRSPALERRAVLVAQGNAAKLTDVEDDDWKDF